MPSASGRGHGDRAEDQPRCDREPDPDGELGQQADQQPLGDRVHPRHARRSHVVVSAPAAEDRDEHDDHHGHAGGQAVGQEHPSQSRPGAVGDDRADDAEDDEQREGTEALRRQAELHRPEAQRRHQGEAEDGIADGRPHGGGGQTRTGQLQAEVDAEDRHQPGDADEGAPTPGRRVEQGLRPVHQLPGEAEQRDGQGDQGRNEDQLLDRDVVGHGISSIRDGFVTGSRRAIPRHPFRCTRRSRWPPRRHR